MLDWKVTENDAPFPSETGDTRPPRRPNRRTWGLVLLVTVLLLSVGGYYVYQRVQQSEARIRQDLFTFIRDEERARQAGQSDRAASYWFPQTQNDWQAAYEETFRTPTVSQSVTVTLESVTMTNDTAYVVVGLGTQRQVRAYQLTQSGWRRNSLLQYDWGETDTIGGLDTGVLITYNASDEAFAQQFSEDLSALTPVLASALSPYDPLSSYIPYTSIRIRPAELQGALQQTPSEGAFTSLSPSTAPPLNPDYTVISTEVVLNSPQVVEVPSYWQISGESAVRYTYAEWASQRLMARARIIQTMPNYGRFVEATKHILALRWALSAEEYAVLLEKWRTRGMADGWESPFSPLAVMDARMDPFDPTPMEARMLAVTNVVYGEGNGAQLITLLSPSPPTTAGWDDFFLQGIGRRTTDLEAEARGGTDTVDIPTLPITGRLVRPTDLAAQIGGLAIQPDGTDTAIALSGLRDVSLKVSTPDGLLTLNSSCLYLFPHVTVNGTWRDEGIRLSVSDLTVTDPFPDFQFQTVPPPPNTVALVGQNKQDTYFTNQFDTLAAVTTSGDITTVLTDTTGRLQVYFRSASPQRDGVMLMHGGGGRDCHAVKMTRYTPDDGIVGQWLLTLETEGSYPLWFWDTLTNQGIVVLANENSTMPLSYWRLLPGTGTILTSPDGKVEGGMPRLLRPGGQELVIQRGDPLRYDLIRLENNATVQSFTVASGRIMSEMVFTADGRTLVMVSLYPEQNSLAPLVWKYDAVSDTSAPTPEVLWEPSQGPLYNLQADFRDPSVYAITSDNSSTHLSVTGDVAPRRIIGDTPTHHFLYHLACRSGGVAALTTETSRPTAGPRTVSIFSSDGALRYPPLLLPTTMTLLLC